MAALSRAGTGEVGNLRGWLTTITARVCLNMLRSRNVRREESLTAHVPDPVISAGGQLQPEEETLLADSVGLALQVVLDTLDPAERLAFVLHDMFGCRSMKSRRWSAGLPRRPDSWPAGRGAASRARKYRPRTPIWVASIGGRRVLRRRARRVISTRSSPCSIPAWCCGSTPAQPGRPKSMALRGADAVARQALTGLASGLRVVQLRPALVNGAAGVIVIMRGRPVTVMGFTIVNGKIAEIDAISDPERLAAITAAIPTGE